MGIDTIKNSDIIEIIMSPFKNILKLTGTLVFLSFFLVAHYASAADITVLATQAEQSTTFTTCGTTSGTGCEGLSDYSYQAFTPKAGTFDSIKFYGKTSPDAFFSVTFYNLANPGPSYIYFSVNNYVAGKTDGNGEMELYSITASDLSSQGIFFNGIDTWAVSIFAYNNSGNCTPNLGFATTACFYPSDHLGNSSNQPYFSIEGTPTTEMICNSIVDNHCYTTTGFSYTQDSVYAGSFPDTSTQLTSTGTGSFYTNDIYIATYPQDHWWRFVNGPNIYYLNVKYSDGTWTTGSIPPPPPPGCTSDCFSNVLFLPGLEASRLYKPGNILNPEDQLWEPNDSSDVEDLYLNTDGVSINPNIYTKDIINESNTPIYTGSAGQNIYKSFSETMGNLMDTNKINAWAPYVYDWRQNIADIVNNGTKTKTGVVTLTDTLQSLANSSKNGKVTIIAHSNGGLLAKAFLQKLQSDKDYEINNLIDNVDVLILVAVPEIGTAEAVPAIMHGYDQQIAGGFLLDNVHARELGRNMLGAYGLLPSKDYINRVSASPVTFVDSIIPSNITTKLVQTFGSAVSSYDEYKDFLFGAEGRTNPLPSETNLPISIPKNLFTEAENLHNIIDAWTPPSNLTVIEVAGWGLDTVASFEYYPRLECSGSLNCEYILDERPRFTSDGDGTVVVPSAQYMSLTSSEKYWVDINKFNILQFPKIKHSNILEVDSLENLIKSVIEKKSIVSDNVLKNTIPLDVSTRLRLSIHSPVTLDAYDADGNHTGKICPQSSDFCYVEENISNSSYLEFGEGKYLNLPEDEAKSIKLKGTGTGTFTYKSEKVLPDGTSTTTSFVDIPVTLQTTAEVTQDPINADTLVLKLDKNGDGINDFNVIANSGDSITLPKPLTITAENKDITLGNPIPNLAAILSGFDNGDTQANSTTGIPSCTSTATNLSTVGNYPITCTIGTLISNKYSFATFTPGTLRINYRFDGFLQPINDTAHQIGPSLSVFKAGSTVPVKFQLKKSNGTIIHTGAIPVWLPPQKGTSMSSPVDESIYNDTGTSGTNFKWDGSQYIYNWSTKGLAAGYWYKISVILDDGNTHSVTVGLR
ncbi:MAG: PxKF domain-containing protein [Candidatus Paceibacterota bacterium]